MRDLTPGQPVTLTFVGDPDLGNRLYTETHTFVALTGEGEDARATFRAPAEGDRPAYEWQAYRFTDDEHGWTDWAYGTSAERLLVNLDPADLAETERQHREATEAALAEGDEDAAEGEVEPCGTCGSYALDDDDTCLWCGEGGPDED